MRNIAFLIVIILTVAVAVSCSLEKSADNGGDSVVVSEKQVESKKDVGIFEKVIKHDNDDILNRINNLESELVNRIDSVSLTVDNTKVQQQLTDIEAGLKISLNDIAEAVNKRETGFKNQLNQVFIAVFAMSLLVVFVVLMAYRGLKKFIADSMIISSYKQENPEAFKTSEKTKSEIEETVTSIQKSLVEKIKENSDLLNPEKALKSDSAMRNNLTEINRETLFLRKAGVQPSVEQRYLTGVEKILDKNYSDGTDIFAAINKDEEKFSSAWFMAGYIAYVTRKYDTAIEKLQKACELEPENSSYLISYGNACLKNSNYKEASTALKKALELTPEDPSAWNNLAHAYTFNNELEKAAGAFKKATELKSDFHEAFHNLGLAYGKLEKLEEALEAFESALNIKEDKHESMYNAACVYAILGKRDGALKNLKGAIELQPEYAEKAKADKDFESFKEDTEFNDIVK